MNKYELDADLQNDRGLAERVRSLAPVVDEVLGSAGGDINVRWRLTKADPARPFAVLNLCDWSFPWGVDRGFEPDELEDSRDFRRKVRSTLLALQMKQLQKGIAELQAMNFAEGTS